MQLKFNQIEVIMFYVYQACIDTKKANQVH